jgi:hypothetical protein
MSLLFIAFMATSCEDNANWVILPDLTPDPETPEAVHVYMIGDEFGSWDWASSGIVDMIPVNGHAEDQFWCVRYITAGKGFKWCQVKDWDGDFAELNEVIGYEVKDGNAVVAEDGFYIVYIDLTGKRIAVEPAQVWGIGDCFGGWDQAKFPFVADGKSLKITTTKEGELRIYTKSSIVTDDWDWWKMEFVILNGKIEYRGAGDDQDRNVVAAGKTVSLDFNAGTGSVQ